MKNDNVHDFFHGVSRITIILPIIIIAVAIILKPNKFEQSQVKSNQYVVSPTVTPLATPAVSPSGIPINLKGPFICSVIAESEYSGVVYIKNKNVLGDMLVAKENTKLSVVLKDDCIYKWQQGAKTGVKMCGLSPYLSILDTMSNLNLLDAGILMTMITKYGDDSGAANLTQKAPVVTCKKDAVEDTIFVIPKSVQFQLRTIATPSASIK